VKNAIINGNKTLFGQPIKQMMELNHFLLCRCMTVLLTVTQYGYLIPQSNALCGT